MSARHSGLEAIVQWARTTRSRPLGAELVPGATSEERSALAALGGLVRAVTTSADRARWPDAVAKWCDDGPAPPPTVAEELNACLDDEQDALATLYEVLVKGPNRRHLGTFFTPARVVEFMLDRTSEWNPTPKAVLDPGAGVGAFSLAASRRWPDATITSVDLNVVTLGLLGLRCAHADARNVTFVHSDYLSWIGDVDAAPTARLFVGNPPYTRHQEFDTKLRNSLTADAAKLVDSGLAGLSAYFLAASLAALAPADSLCFVLPGSWTEARYGRAIRRWLWNAKHRQVELHAFPAPLEVFTGTNVTSMVLCVGPETMSPAGLTVYKTSIRRGAVTTSAGQPRSRAKNEPASFGPWLWPHTAPKAARVVPLREIARVRRGVATGANHFFFLTDEDAEPIPNAGLIPALRRLRHVAGDTLTQAVHDQIGRDGLPRWMLWLADPGIAADEHVQRMLRDAERAGTHHGHLLSRRSPWYVVEDVAPPDIITALMSKGDIRAVRNEAAVVPSNSMYGIYLHEPATSTALCTWLNSQQGQLAIKAKARHYGGGLLKLEPRELLDVRVPSSLKRLPHE